MKTIAILQNTIQDYPWGSKTFIPMLLGESVPSKKPYAELWMGAHPKAVSRVLSHDREMALDIWIQDDPDDVLGHRVAKKFSNLLPFLFKILACEKPLSIQAHPNKKRAIEGFEKENQAKIPSDADNRNYRDENHKPELICALEPFTALKGFRRISEIISLMDSAGIPDRESGLGVLREHPDQDGLGQFFQHLMSLSKESQSNIVNRALLTLQKKPKGIDPAVIQWVYRLHGEYPGDIGVLSPLYLNLIQLKPREAMFIPAGELHAYLKGAGLEIMANSDNVLRGGLTTKHVDVQELCRILQFEPDPISTLKPVFHSTQEGFYQTPAKEFTLSVISLQQGVPYESKPARSVEIMICTEGNARIKDIKKGDALNFSKGNSIIIPAAVKQYQIQGEATIYKAGVPL